MESSEDKQVIRKLKCISVISLIFMTVEIVGGLMANSVAILADAFHLLSDVLAYVISLQAVLLSHKLPPFGLTFGYQKAQPLGALLNIGIIWFVTFELLLQATNRIFNKQIVEKPIYMLLTSFFGLGCNLVIMKVLHSDSSHGCSHSHGHDHKGIGHTDHSHGQKKAHKHSAQEGHQGLQQLVEAPRSSTPKKHHTHSQSCLGSQYPYTYICQETGEDELMESKEIIRPPLPHNHSKDEHHHQQHKHGHKDQHGHGNCKGHGHDHDHGHEHKHEHGHGHSHENEHEHQHENEHEHGNDIQHEHERRNIFRNINIEAAYIHIISDIILSVGVIVSALIIYWKADPTTWTYWQLADPFCTYLFSIVAIYSTLGIAKDSIMILLDGCDDISLLRSITADLDSLDQLDSYSGLKVWSMNRQKYYGMVKLSLKEEEADQIWKVQKKVKKFFESKRIQACIEIHTSEKKN